MRLVPTAPVAAASFVLGYGVVVATGSRTLGGLVLLLGGAWCVRAWLDRRGPRTAVVLLGVAAAAFVASHLLGLLVGAWPAVLLAAAFVGGAVWVRADADAGAGAGRGAQPAEGGAGGRHRSTGVDAGLDHQ